MTLDHTDHTDGTLRRAKDTSVRPLYNTSSDRYCRVSCQSQLHRWKSLLQDSRCLLICSSCMSLAAVTLRSTEEQPGRIGPPRSIDRSLVPWKKRTAGGIHSLTHSPIHSFTRSSLILSFIRRLVLPGRGRFPPRSRTR